MYTCLTLNNPMRKFRSRLSPQNLTVMMWSELRKKVPDAMLFQLEWKISHFWII